MATRLIAMDTEGYPGDPWGLSFSLWPGTARVIKATDTVGLGFFREWLHRNREDLMIILHNALFDLGMLREMGIDLSRFKFVDTMVMAYLLCIEPQSLKPLSHRHCGMELSDYDDVVGPYAQPLYRNYLEAAASVSWPPPEQTCEVVDGKLKFHKPWSIAKRLSRIISDSDKPLDDIYGGMFDFKRRWKGLDDDIRDEIEATCGPFPLIGLQHVPDKVAIPYSAGDADATLRVFQSLSPRIHALDLRTIRDLDFSVIPMVDKMQQYGFGVDPGYFKDLGTVLQMEMGALKDDVRALTGNPDFNPGSPPQVAKFLFQDLGLEPVKMTAKRTRAAVDDKTLEEVKQRYYDNPLAVKFIDLRGEYAERQKLWGTYVYQLPRWISVSDHRIHPTLRITRVVSGRLSSSDPNLLAIPTRTNLGRLVRQGFVAPPGRLLGSWDLDQVEMRVMAHESQDTNMIAVLSDPTRHIHKETCAGIYGIPVSQVNKESTEYMMAKNISFGIIYGITARGLQAQMALRGQFRTLDECQDMIDAFTSRVYPGIGVYMQEQIAKARREDCVTSMLGRIRYLPGIHSSVDSVASEACRIAVNHPIQSGAADIVKSWMREVWRRVQVSPGVLLADPLLQVHDELIMEFDAEMREIVDEIVKDALQAAVAPLGLRVPIRCGGKTAKTWGELK